MTKKCSDGYILRDGYTTSKGTVVKSTCIKSTSESGKKSENVNKPIIQEMLKKQKKAEELTSNISPKKCPSGMIRRSAYIKNEYTKTSLNKTIKIKKTIVPADCIKEKGEHTGKSGLYSKTGERIYIVFDKDHKLGEYGYHDLENKTVKERHDALNKVYKAMNKNWLSLFRMLNYLAVLNKNNEKLHKIFIDDRNYIKNKYSQK